MSYTGLSLTFFNASNDMPVEFLNFNKGRVVWVTQPFSYSDIHRKKRFPLSRPLDRMSWIDSVQNKLKLRFFSIQVWYRQTGEKSSFTCKILPATWNMRQFDSSRDRGRNTLHNSERTTESIMKENFCDFAYSTFWETILDILNVEEGGLSQTVPCALDKSL